MPNTFIKISTVTVGASGAANIEFTSIPQTFTDLLLVVSTRTTRASHASYSDFTINNTSTSGRFLEGNGSSASSGASQSSNIDNSDTATASVFASGQFYLPNYTSANKKSYSVDSASENNATVNGMSLVAGLYDSTSAITSIKITPQASASYKQYSTATLYGITKA